MAGQLDWANVFRLERASRVPLSDQIYATLVALIQGGELRPGHRLPTTRDLASTLSVNRGTVQAAYRKLAGEGRVATRVGSGTVVHAATQATAFELTGLLSARAAGIRQEPSAAAAGPLVADFSRLTPDERFFPLEDFTRTLAYTWSRRNDLWQYAPPLGLEELRLEICHRLAEHGIERTADEVLVTSGAQQGLDLLFRTFADPGDAVAMESPTYPGALAIARFSGVDIHPLPMGPDGPDASGLAGQRVKLVYVMPERQNPTGITASLERRQSLLEASIASGALIIEDGYEEPESGVPPLASLNRERVVWLGTLSKDLVPGFRIGWIAAPEPVIELIARVKQTADFQTPLPLQAAVAAFLRAGGDRKARRNRSLEVETRRISAARALRTNLPELSWWGGGVGNPIFWLQLPEGVSGRRVSEASAARGVAVAAGAEFDVTGEDLPALRISVTRVEKRQIDQGIRLLAEAVREVQSRTGAARSMPVV